MRQITEKVVGAFLRGEACSLKNTRTDGRHLWLFDNLIATNTPNIGMHITTAGYDTQTTLDRLNGITGVYVKKRNGQLYLNGRPWDGCWTYVSWFNAHNGVFDADDVESEVPHIVENITETEPEFDVTSEWNKKGYIKPIYSVFHSNDYSEAKGVIKNLKDNSIPCRIVETDTAGVYRPNYFVVVQPEKIDVSLKLLLQ